MITKEELEKRPMSTWTREETDYYNHVTGQCGCPYACVDVENMQIRIDRLEAAVTKAKDALEEHMRQFRRVSWNFLSDHERQLYDADKAAINNAITLLTDDSFLSGIM